MKRKYLICSLILFALAGCNVSQATSSSEEQSSDVSSVVDPNALLYELSTSGTSYEVKAENKDTISGDIVIPDLHDNKPVTLVGIGGFGNTQITSIKMPRYLLEISMGAFVGCNKLVTVDFNDDIQNIGGLAFSGCSSLTQVTLPEDLTKMGNSVFSECSTLTEITLPNKLTEIGEYVFEDCTSLKFVDTGNSLKTITRRCFSNCEKLETIRISKKITSIDSYAFSSCSALAKIYYSGTEEEWDAISIDEYNESLDNATRYYYSEEEPTGEGHYWHYVNNVITEW